MNEDIKKDRKGRFVFGRIYGYVICRQLNQAGLDFPPTSPVGMTGVAWTRSGDMSGKSGTRDTEGHGQVADFLAPIFFRMIE